MKYRVSRGRTKVKGYLTALILTQYDANNKKSNLFHFSLGEDHALPHYSHVCPHIHRFTEILCFLYFVLSLDPTRNTTGRDCYRFYQVIWLKLFSANTNPDFQIKILI